MYIIEKILYLIAATSNMKENIKISVISIFPNLKILFKTKVDDL